jgi:YHS domain-containing protein
MRSFWAVESEGFSPYLEWGRDVDRREFLHACAAVFGAAVGLGARQSRGADGAADTAHPERKTSKPPLLKELLSARCPVTGNRVSAEASLDYLGGKVFFDSQDSIREFKRNRSQYEAKARAQLVLTGQYKQVGCPVDGKDLSLGIKAKILGVDVRFCSAQCAKKVRQASLDDRLEWVFVKGFNRGFAAKQEATVARQSGTDPDEDRWECSVCGYVHRGSSPPGLCPQCGAKSDSFVRKT